MWVEPDFGNTVTRMDPAPLATAPSARPRLHTESTGAVSAMTMNAFLVVYIRNHVNQLTPVVAAEMRNLLLGRHFAPLRAYALVDLTPLIVEAWFHEIGRHSHAQANKSLSILRTMFGKARDWRVFIGDNPAARVKKYPRYARERFVTPEEMPRLMAVLQREDERMQCFFLLCLLVGCRRGEALTLQWADLDSHQRVWRKRTTKTRRAHTVPIPASLFARLQALPHTNEFVFATNQGHWSRTRALVRWHRIRRAAGLGDVTIHDLRRTCASWLCIHGSNLAVIGRGVLNHTSLAHTGIYARLQTGPVALALEENSTRMLGSGPGAPPSPILTAGMVPFQREEQDEWPG